MPNSEDLHTHENLNRGDFPFQYYRFWIKPEIIGTKCWIRRPCTQSLSCKINEKLGLNGKFYSNLKRATWRRFFIDVSWIESLSRSYFLAHLNLHFHAFFASFQFLNRKQMKLRKSTIWNSMLMIRITSCSFKNLRVCLKLIIWKLAWKRSLWNFVIASIQDKISIPIQTCWLV